MCGIFVKEYLEFYLLKVKVSDITLLNKNQCPTNSFNSLNVAFIKSVDDILA